MELKNKLILEGLEDDIIEEPIPEVEPVLDVPEKGNYTKAEDENFNVNVVTDILNRVLEVYSVLLSYTSQREPISLADDTKIILDSVGEDLAISIGKLQEGLKSAASETQGDLMLQGQEDAQDELIGHTPIEEPQEE